jgi:hypothetical protein
LLKANKPLQRAQAFDSAGFQQRSSPGVSMRTDSFGLGQQPSGSALDAIDLLRRQMFAERAEPDGLATQMHGDLFQTPVERAHDPPIPACPNRSAQVFGRS